MDELYISIDDVKNYLLTEVADYFEPQIEKWILQMQKHIERITGRTFLISDYGESGGPSATERKYDGDGTGKLLIDDCVAVESFKIGVDDESEYVEGTDFFLYPANETPKKRIELDQQIFPQGKQNIIVKAFWGYSAEVPEDLKFALVVLVSGIINYGNNADGEVKSESIGAYSVTYKDEKQWQDFERAQEIIETYKKFSF